MNVSNADILALIGAETRLKRVATTNGGEYAGACPFCGGSDRLRVWPTPRKGDGRGRYWCRQCERKGDAAQYVMERDGVSFPEACRRLGLDGRNEREGRGKNEVGVAGGTTDGAIQSATWQARGEVFCEECERTLWEHNGERALAYLRQRGFTDDTLQAARLGFNAQERWEASGDWGLSGKKVWLPVGVVIPFWDGRIAKVQIRRSDRAGEPRYLGVRGSGNALWNADGVDGAKPVVLNEGVFTALAVQQCAGDLCVAVAAGSTAGARLSQWIARLSLAPLVLVAFDADESGDKAAEFWLDILPKARRCRPFWGDANEMARDGADVRAWIEAGLRHAGALPTPEEEEKAEADAEPVAETERDLADYPEPDAYLTARFRECIDAADAAGGVEAMGVLKSRDRRLWLYLNDLLNDREERLSRDWRAFQEGVVEKGAVMYAMERWAEVLTTFADCRG